MNGAVRHVDRELRRRIGRAHEEHDPGGGQLVTDAFRVETADIRLPRLAAEAIENAERNEPTLPIDRTEPVQPSDRIESSDEIGQVPLPRCARIEQDVKANLPEGRD